MNRLPLEPAAEKICEENSKPPFFFHLSPKEARTAFDKEQDAPIYKYPASVTTIPVETGRWGRVKLHYIVPKTVSDTPGVIYFLHGGGWVFGNLHTHDKLVRELASRTNSVVFFPEYSLSPEAKYPAAVEQCYSILQNLPNIADRNQWKLNFEDLTIAGDSAGGNLAAVLCIMSKVRNGIKIQKQLLYYPVTNACFNTLTYNEFSEGYYLSREGMIWLWEQYTNSERERIQVAASPLQAAIDQLAGLPDTCIINAEADILRDEGQSYAKKLLQAGVNVTAIQIQAAIHGFVTLNALDQTNSCRTAMHISAEWVREG